jgi:hypothetical protein
MQLGFWFAAVGSSTVAHHLSDTCGTCSCMQQKEVVSAYFVQAQETLV